MELRQLRYFVKVCESRSMGRAALELGVVTSALSQQISRLEGELSTRLLQRSSVGVLPTDAGLAFLQQAQLTLRHADDAVRAARLARLSGHVSIGLAPTTASVLGVPLLQAMHIRYPDIRLHFVEALSGHLGNMLNARQLDLAIVFQPDTARRWHLSPLLDEKLFLVASPALDGAPGSARVRMKQLAKLPLVLPSSTHDLRIMVETAFARAKISPHVVLEVDGLALLMSVVRMGIAASIQPGAAMTRLAGAGLNHAQIADAGVGRKNLLASLSDDELSPAGLAARVVLLDVARTLVREGRWAGASLLEN
jgi:LysR family tcuABC transcriptional regulator